jgi:hypothetical protein
LWSEASKGRPEPTQPEPAPNRKLNTPLLKLAHFLQQ